VDSQTLHYLQGLEARLTAVQLLAAGTGAWGPLRRLALDVRATIDESLREMDRSAEERMLEGIRNGQESRS